MYKIMNSKKLNDKLNKILKKWEVVNKSPYSNSFYNTNDISWGSKPEGSLRISDHWNFRTQGELHCETTCGTTEGWYLGVYTNGKYELIKWKKKD